jgi:hypothetical protein
VLLVSTECKVNGKTKIENVNQKLQVLIRDRKIVFYGKEKLQLSDKISKRMNTEYCKKEPNPKVLKMLSKKMQMLNNSHDGVISLDGQDYSYHIFIKWSFNKNARSLAD